MRREKRAGLFVLAFLLLFNFLAVPAFSENLTVVEITVSFAKGKPEIIGTNITKIIIDEETGEGYGFSPPPEGAEYSVMLYSEGEKTSAGAAIYKPLGLANVKEWAAIIIPEEQQGKPLSLAIERAGKIVDSREIVYCGDKTCSKGERATTCPSDCILGGLAPQQGSKKIPYIAAGLFLLIVSGAILYIVTKKGQ